MILGVMGWAFAAVFGLLFFAQLIAAEEERKKEDLCAWLDRRTGRLQRKGEKMSITVRSLDVTGTGGSAGAPAARDSKSMAADPRGGIIVGKGVKFERIRRITGYLVGTLERFNDAKYAEVRDRVKHADMGSVDAGE